MFKLNIDHVPGNVLRHWEDTAIKQDRLFPSEFTFQRGKLAGYEIKEGDKMKNSDLQHDKYPNGRSQGKMLGQWSFFSSFLVPQTGFVEDRFLFPQTVWDGGMVWGCSNCVTLLCDFYYYYISSTSDHLRHQILEIGNLHGRWHRSGRPMKRWQLSWELDEITSAVSKCFIPYPQSFRCFWIVLLSDKQKSIYQRYRLLLREKSTSFFS